MRPYSQERPESIEVDFPEIKTIDKNGEKKQVMTGKTQTIQVDNHTPVAENKEFFTYASFLIAAEAGRKALSMQEIWFLRKACQRHEIYPDEFMEGFWEAAGDPYVGSQTIQFRHLFKYIKEARGEQNKVYNYKEYAAMVADGEYDGDDFEVIEQEDSQKVLFRLKK